MTFTISDSAYGTDTPQAKEAMFADLRSQLQGLLSGESDFIANTAAFEPALKAAVEAGTPTLLHLKLDTDVITTRTTLSAIRKAAEARR